MVNLTALFYLSDMKKFKFLGIVVAIFMATMPSAFARSDSHRAKAVAVRSAGDDGVAHYRIPGIVTTRKGTLVAVYDIRRDGWADLQGDISIGVSRSFDGGKSWEAMQVAMSFAGYGGLPADQNGVGDPSILYDDVNDRLWIAASWLHGIPGKRAWRHSGPGMEPEQTGQLVLC